MNTLPTTNGRDVLASRAEKLKAAAVLQVTSPAFPNRGSIPEVHSAYGRNISFAVEWTPGPFGTQSYALFLEDPDAHVDPLPAVHWIAWNIPAEVHSLPAALPFRPAEPEAMRQGLNVAGGIGYTGPKPPAGDPAHRYYIQLFALDVQLRLSSTAQRHDLLDACAGHVLAAGLLEGIFAAPSRAARS